MKKKAIHAEYRKISESFPEWLKYEVTILAEDGTTTKVPAYGKDLQDALSRVVHDEKVEKVEKKLANKGFVDRAPAEVVKEHHERMEDWRNKLEHTKKSLEALESAES